MHRVYPFPLFYFFCPLSSRSRSTKQAGRVPKQRRVRRESPQQTGHLEKRQKQQQQDLGVPILLSRNADPLFFVVVCDALYAMKGGVSEGVRWGEKTCVG